MKRAARLSQWATQLGLSLSLISQAAGAQTKPEAAPARVTAPISTTAPATTAVFDGVDLAWADKPPQFLDGDQVLVTLRLSARDKRPQQGEIFIQARDLAQGRTVLSSQQRLQITPGTSSEIEVTLPSRVGMQLRLRYVDAPSGAERAAAWVVPYLLTPPDAATPAFHGARVLGARPGTPLHHRVAATGTAPLVFSAQALPPGLVLDAGSGVITGITPPAGRYAVQLRASNALGITLWTVAGSSGLYATQIGPDGHIWATDGSDPGLYRLAPDSRQMCRYQIPSTTASLYVEANEQGVWLADGNGEYVYRLDPAANEFTLWQLPTAGFPSGLDLDPDGDLWWADYDLGVINRLEADINRLATFTPTISSFPVMLDASAGEVWFTDDLNSLIGKVSPSTASSATLTLARSTVTVEPSCTTVEPAAAKPITVTTEVKAFTKTGYDQLVDDDSWTILEVPDQGAPYGVRLSGSSTWVVDYGRQILSRIPSEDSYAVYLPQIQR